VLLAEQPMKKRIKKPMNMVGPQVRKIRKQQGLTQPALAAKCQVLGWDLSRESLAKIESRLRGVSDWELIGLSLALNIPFELLYPDRKSIRPTFKAILQF
jgi:transcriptional regulator with XRE-family HTH domain